jgi:predicted acylesterase/phospholipase RssA
MAASCCVPALFSPIEFEGMTCHDGGVAHELPMDFWFEDEGVDVIIAHRIIPPSASRSSFFPMNLIELSGAAHETVSHQLLHYREVLAAKAGKRLIFADTHHARPPLMFGRKLPECYELGYRSAQELHDKTLRPLLDA